MRSWSFRRGFVELRLTLERAPRAGEAPSDDGLAYILYGLRTRDPGVCRAVHDVGTYLRGGLPRRDLAHLTDAMLDALEQDLRTAATLGRVRVFRRDVVRMPVKAKEPEAPPAPPSETNVDTTWFSLKLLDEVGDPIDGVDVVFSVDGGKKKVTTNGAGVARLEDAHSGHADAGIANRASLRKKLKPRWSTPRDENIPTGDSVFVRDFDGEIEPAQLQNEVPATMVITPFFRCNEIPGAHFAFARSFVLRDAIPMLSEIAEALQAKDENGEPLDRKAAIFGHTDLSGGDALNKELSERRAKAVYALLTHDADKWEELFSNSPAGTYWSEKWDVWEVQHMLNTLGVTDDAGHALAETGARDLSTQQAIKRFRRADYPDCPAEQAPLPESIYLGKDGRKELFLAYAKRVTREKIDPGKFTAINGHPFMGCGLYNPLSLKAMDQESRRAIIFVYDVAAEKTDYPCALGDIGPCKGVCAPQPKAMPADGSAPYRCSVYKQVAKKCPCQGGPDLSHDLLVRLYVTEKQAASLPHVFVLESDDGTIAQKHVLKSESRATDDQLVELRFEHVPDWHSYRLRCEGVSSPYTSFDYTPFEKIHELSPAGTAPLAAGVLHAVASGGEVK